MEKTVEHLLEEPYWIIDILPEQVPYEGDGQYFAVEKYFLEKERLAEIKRKHINVILKLNCYRDIYIDGENEVNPVPEHIEQEMKRHYLCIMVNDSMIVSEPDDTHMTLFGPDEKLLELVKKIAVGEGLYVWQPMDR